MKYKRKQEAMLGHWGSSWESTSSRLEQPYKQERHHTCTQNLKAMALWESIYSPCSEALTCLYRRCWFLHKRTDTFVPSLLLSAQMDWLPRSYSSSNRGSDITVGSLRELGGRPHQG